MRQRRFYDPERRVDVGLHRRVEVFRRDVQNRLTRLLPARIADDDVETAEAAHGFLDQALAERLVPEVAGNWERFPAGLLDQCDHLTRIRLFGRKIVDRDIGAFAGVSNSRGTTHAGITAGDQRFASRQAAGAFVACLAVIGRGFTLAAWPG